jgi:carbonic anhydrase
MCSGASVTISDDRSHLSVKCSGGSKTTISFYGKIYAPTEIRIYAPSLHTYNGSHADAEMMIVHTPSTNSNSNGNNEGLIVSIPIMMTTASSASGNGNSDLAAIIQAANSINASTIALNASTPLNHDINVNSFIPAKPYYVYYGTLPYDSCGGNYYYAVFTDPVSAAGPLSNIVDNHIATVPQSMKTNLQKSKTGPVAGVGSDSAEEYVLFQLVGDDDNHDAESNPNSTKSDNGGTTIGSQSIGMNIVWGIIIAIILLGLAYMYLSTSNGNAGNGNAGNAVNAVNTGSS